MNDYPMPRPENDERATIRRLGQVIEQAGRLLTLPSVSVDIAPALDFIRAADEALYRARRLVDPTCGFGESRPPSDTIENEATKET